jgi:hypothetical protein
VPHAAGAGHGDPGGYPFRAATPGTLTLRDGKPLKLVAFDQLGAIEHARRYRENSVLWSSVRKVSCRAFWRLMMKVLAARDELVALEQAGWRTVNVDNLRIGPVHERILEGRRRVVCARLKTTGGDSGAEFPTGVIQT